MVDKTTPRLGLPVPFLTNPLKIDVGKLTQALNMIDSNAVMLNDWDITADGWQKMGTITDLDQGKIALSLMVITGTGFANIVMQSGDGSVTTVGNPARISVTAQTNLGTNESTILGGVVKETAKNAYEVWFNIAPSTAPRKWSGLLAAGNGAKIDWTHATGAKPTGGVDILIARSLTDQEIASDTITRNGGVLTAGYAGLMGLSLPYFVFAPSGDTITSHNWRTGETMRVKVAEATGPNGFPAGVAATGATGWRIHCEGVNETRAQREFVFHSEGATPSVSYRLTWKTAGWGAARKIYASDNPPKATEVSAVPQLTSINTAVDLNSLTNPSNYGVTSFTNAAGATAENNFPFNEPGELYNLPYGLSGVSQLFIALSGRVAARTYNGSTFTGWRKTATSGANDDITSLTALSGPLTLGGDGAGDYDAVTLRQLKAVAGGSGPTMNGVVNNFLGAVEWWNGSRAKLPAGYLPADGQVLLDADYPELSAAVRAGMFAASDYGPWLSDPSLRGGYSLGTAGTNFRLPDLNGAYSDPSNVVAQNSIRAPFLRGDSGGVSAATIGNVGKVLGSSVPNLFGNLNFHGSQAQNGGTVMAGVSGNGFLAQTGQQTGYSQATITTAAVSFAAAVFDASKANAVYGRVNANGSAGNEVRPNSIAGIWIIRVAASFQAANTSFNVFNGDAAAPGNNTTVLGGTVSSTYTIAGVNKSTASLISSAVYNSVENSMVVQAVIQPRNHAANKIQNFVFDTNGDAWIPRYMVVNNLKPYTGNLIDIAALVTCNDLHTAAGGGLGVRGKAGVDGENNAIEMGNSGTGTISAGGVVNSLRGYWYKARWELFGVRSGDQKLEYCAMRLTPDGTLPATYKEITLMNTGVVKTTLGDVALQGSDISLKDDVVPAKPGALSRIRKIITREFDWKHDGRHDRGVIAQELAEIDPTYAYKSGELMNVSYMALIADLIESVKHLSDQLDSK